MTGRLERQVAEMIRAYENGVDMPLAERRTMLDQSGQIEMKNGKSPLTELSWAVKCADMVRYAYEVDQVSIGDYEPIEIVNMGMTPKVLVDGGMPELPMAYTQRHLLDAIHEQDVLLGHYHGLPVELVKRIPELMEEPVAICDSPVRKDVAIMLLNATDPNKDPIIAVVKPSARATYRNSEIRCNLVLSMYGKRNATRYFGERVKAKRMAFVDDEKARELEALAGLQLPRCHHRARNGIIRRLGCVDNNATAEKGSVEAEKKSEIVFSAPAETLESGYEWQVDTRGNGWLHEKATNKRRFKFSAENAIDAEWIRVAERIAAIPETGNDTPSIESITNALTGTMELIKEESDVPTRFGPFLKSKVPAGTRYITAVAGLKLTITRGNTGLTTWKLAKSHKEALCKGSFENLDDERVNIEMVLNGVCKEYKPLVFAMEYPPISMLQFNFEKEDERSVETTSLRVTATCCDGSTWAVESKPVETFDTPVEPIVVTYGSTLQEAYDANVTQRRLAAFTDVELADGRRQVQAKPEQPEQPERAEKPVKKSASNILKPMRNPIKHQMESQVCKTPSRMR